MFENLEIESEERRTNPPTVKVTASPEIVALIGSAWGKQQESGDKSLGHIVKLNATPEVVEQFHAEARQACKDHEPRLKYRKLARVGKSKDEKHAYFAVSLWPVDEPEGESTEGTEDAPDSQESGETPEPTPEPAAAATEQKATTRPARARK